MCRKGKGGLKKGGRIDFGPIFVHLWQESNELIIFIKQSRVNCTTISRRMPKRLVTNADFDKQLRNQPTIDKMERFYGHCRLYSKMSPIEYLKTIQIAPYAPQCMHWSCPPTWGRVFDFRDSRSARIILVSMRTPMQLWLCTCYGVKNILFEHLADFRIRKHHPKNGPKTMTLGPASPEHTSDVRRCAELLVGCAAAAKQSECCYGVMNVFRWRPRYFRLDPILFTLVPRYPHRWLDGKTNV
jgi:hypothetical protein